MGSLALILVLARGFRNNYSDICCEIAAIGCFLTLRISNVKTNAVNSGFFVRVSNNLSFASFIISKVPLPFDNFCSVRVICTASVKRHSQWCGSSQRPCFCFITRDWSMFTPLQHLTSGPELFRRDPVAVGVFTLLRSRGLR